MTRTFSTSIYCALPTTTTLPLLPPPPLPTTSAAHSLTLTSCHLTIPPSNQHAHRCISSSTRHRRSCRQAAPSTNMKITFRVRCTPSGLRTEVWARRAVDCGESGSRHPSGCTQLAGALPATIRTRRLALSLPAALRAVLLTCAVVVGSQAEQVRHRCRAYRPRMSSLSPCHALAAIAMSHHPPPTAYQLPLTSMPRALLLHPTQIPFSSIQLREISS